MSGLRDAHVGRALGALSAATVALPAGVAARVAVGAWPALVALGPAAFLTGGTWSPSAERWSILPMVAASAVSTGAAVALAGPVALAVALHLRGAGRGSTAVRAALDLLAGVPSVVFGLVALQAIVPLVRTIQPPGLSLLAASFTLAAMILPTLALGMDAALRQVPEGPVRAARALGLGPWATARAALLPAAMPGFRVAVAVALTRALGETMAVLMVAGNTVAWPSSPFAPVRTLTGGVAVEMAYASGVHRSALFVSALALFALATPLVLGRRAGVAHRAPPGAALGEGGFRAATGLCAAAVLVGTAGLVGLTVAGGVEELSADFLVSAARDAGRAGGIASVLVSTAGVLAVALLAAVPVGLATAIWLAEYAGPRAGPVRAALDLLAAVPSIVHGLFGMALFCEALGLGWSLASGGLTLAVMILPLFTRLSEAALRSVPDVWRRAGAAAGLDRWQLLGPVLLPAALPGLIAALVLSLGRALGESAALLFTAGSALRMPEGLHDPGRTLALHVYVMAVDVPGGQGRAAASALVLFAFAAASAGIARAAPALVARRVAC